ncbi:hypothetical protein KI809_05795 [Geobacter pelophilus]|uniref:Zinc-or iron-chelating domain-containing protein n=1 Tax=Geoanaerobacter pelophilus TaxID=60036 RepID=A0AAW4KYU3_9BACT|nr:hypothetical protein [Geoanaerobacter pelophilus]
MSHSDAWSTAIAVATREFKELPGHLSTQVAGIVREILVVKREVDAIFDGLNGVEICRLCQGECCRSGCYHFTVVDLLGYLVTGHELFSPRFDNGACPFLGDSGCMMAPHYRPYNCVTFVCDRVDAGMDSNARARFAALSADLFVLYQRLEQLFANRFVYGILNNSRRFAEGRSIGILWSEHGND